MSLRFLVWSLEERNITRSACSKGSPRKRKAFTRVKTVVLTPIPSASATTTTAVNPGSRTRRRTPNLMSWKKLIYVPLQRSSQCLIYYRVDLLPSWRGHSCRHSCLPRRDSSRRFCTSPHLCAMASEVRPDTFCEGGASPEKRRHECRRGRQECPRHVTPKLPERNFPAKSSARLRMRHNA